MMNKDARMLKEICFLEAKHLKRMKSSSPLQDSYEFLGNVDQEHDVRMSVRYHPSDSVRENEAIGKILSTPRSVLRIPPAIPNPYIAYTSKAQR